MTLWLVAALLAFFVSRGDSNVGVDYCCLEAYYTQANRLPGVREQPDAPGSHLSAQNRLEAYQSFTISLPTIFCLWSPTPDNHAVLCCAVPCPLQVILMDHVDWLDQKTVQELVNTLAQQVLPGGIIIWRSASLNPPYSKVRVRPVAVAGHIADPLLYLFLD
jgi:hypothetical protein